MFDAEALSKSKSMSSSSIIGALKASGKKVVTFVGFSGEYEHPETMLDEAARILRGFDPKTTIVNIGATPQGIGAVYKLAKSLGFKTSGIVSSLAKEAGSQGAISPFVDWVLFVPDVKWGGILPDTGRLSPTSETMVAVSDELVGIGGGAVGRDELLAAKAAGKPVTFIRAEMRHDIAVANAAKANQPAPTEFYGAADKAWTALLTSEQQQQQEQQHLPAGPKHSVASQSQA